MHELDKFNWFELSNPDMPWWLPCPRTCTYNQDAKCWCDSQSDRLSASLVNRNSPPTPQKGIPVYALPDARGVGIVLTPRLAGVLCSYAADAVSYNFQCDPPGASKVCIPGCMSSPGQWAQGSYRGAKGLSQMLGEYEFADAGVYNEVVVDSKFFEQRLPASVEAVYYHADVPSAAELARAMQRGLAKKFGVSGTAKAPPVLAFDKRNWEAPFAEDVGAGRGVRAAKACC